MPDDDDQREPLFRENPYHDTDPEIMAADYLVGKYEIEKLRNGFRAPVLKGEPCADPNVSFDSQENKHE